ncbi:MAG: HPr kinase/phosphatase C-terminal domain-containing protein [Pseudomonadota bacterium]|nr:HPr kinase/phosphatase C-terminal domain-containing protein [Pseudomonadota bacterium]
MERVHGCLIQWLGKGLLLIGESGVGKTTCALEMVRRGAVWVADDLVELTVGADRRPLGRAHDSIRGLAWLPSRGVFTVASAFPSSRAVLECRIVFVVELIKILEKTTGNHPTAGEDWKAMNLRASFLSVIVDEDVQSTVSRIIRRLRRREDAEEG